MGMYFYNKLKLPGFELHDYGGIVAGALIYKKDGIYYLIRHPNNNYTAFTLKYGAENYASPACNSAEYKLVDGEWVYNRSVGIMFEIPLDSVICTNYDIRTYERIFFRGRPFDKFQVQITAFGWTDGDVITSKTSKTIRVGEEVVDAVGIEFTIPVYGSSSFTVSWYDIYTGLVLTEHYDASETQSITSRCDPVITIHNLNPPVMGGGTLTCYISDGETTVESATAVLYVASDDDDDGDDPGGSGGGSGGGGTTETPAVTGIDLTVTPDTVVPGGHALGQVNVIGTGNYNPDFVAYIDGHTSPNTYIVKGLAGFNVWVGQDETADYVLATAQSVHNPMLTATEMLYIDQSGSGSEPEITEEQLRLSYLKGCATARAYFQQAKLAKNARIRITMGEENPSTEAGLRKRAFWKGFVTFLGMLAPFLDSDYVPEVSPENALTSSDGYVLTDRNGLYLIPKEVGNDATMVQFIVTGDENFTYNSANKAVYFKHDDVALKTREQIVDATCTHFTYGAGNVLAEMNDGEFIFNITVADGLTTGNVSFKNSKVFTSKSSAVAWFKEQVANGTPVTVTCYIKEVE